MTNRTPELPNALTDKDNILVPISIITGTRTKRGIK
jgi:hypothetical protein